MSAERTSEDLPPVIAVDWEAVEEDTEREFAPDLRRVIEHVGSTSSVALEPWGYGDESTTALFTAVEEHGQTIHPDRGPLLPRYAPLRNMSAAVNVLRVLRGEDRNIGTVIEDGDGEIFTDGLAGLYDTARALDERRDDWHGDQHPAVSFGSYGPDQLGSHYVHADQGVIESLDVSELPVECEHVLAHGQRSYSSTEGHYTASFRHERYYPKEEPEPTEADERAEEIGFLGANAGKTSLEQAFRDRGHDYRELDAPDVDGVPADLTLYEYEKGEETRYGVEWSQRVSIDDYVIRSLIFGHEPSESDVQTALLIEDSRHDAGTGGRR